MKTNFVAKIISIIGTVVIVCACFFAFYMFIESETGLSTILGIVISVGGFVTGILLVGFAEIIHLLQYNALMQDEILLELQGSRDNESNK